MNKTLEVNNNQVVAINRVDLVVGDCVAIGEGMNSGNYTKYVSEILDREKGIFEIKSDCDFSDDVTEILELANDDVLWVPAQKRIPDWQNMPTVEEAFLKYANA
jgi:hypothetical protein